MFNRLKITKEDILILSREVFVARKVLREWSASAMINHPSLQRIKKQGREKRIKLILAELTFQFKTLQESEVIAKQSQELSNGEIILPN